MACPLESNRKAWLRIKSQIIGTYLIVDDYAAESLKWCGGLRFALFELGVKAVCPLPTKETQSQHQLKGRLSIVILGYLWDFENVLVMILSKNKCDINVFCNITEVEHRSHPMSELLGLSQVTYNGYVQQLYDDASRLNPTSMSTSECNMNVSYFPLHLLFPLQISKKQSQVNFMASLVPWFILNGSNASQTFPLTKFHLKSELRYDHNTDLATLPVNDIPSEKANNLRQLSSSLANSIVNHLGYCVGSRVFALGRTSELVGVKLGSLLKELDRANELPRPCASIVIIDRTQLLAGATTHLDTVPLQKIKFMASSNSHCAMVPSNSDLPTSILSYANNDNASGLLHYLLHHMSNEETMNFNDKSLNNITTLFSELFSESSLSSNELIEATISEFKLTYKHSSVKKETNPVLSDEYDDDDLFEDEETNDKRSVVDGDVETLINTVLTATGHGFNSKDTKKDRQGDDNEMVRNKLKSWQIIVNGEKQIKAKVREWDAIAGISFSKGEHDHQKGELLISELFNYVTKLDMLEPNTSSRLSSCRQITLYECLMLLLYISSQSPWVIDMDETDTTFSQLRRLLLKKLNLSITSFLELNSNKEIFNSTQDSYRWLKMQCGEWIPNSVLKLLMNLANNKMKRIERNTIASNRDINSDMEGSEEEEDAEVNGIVMELSDELDEILNRLSELSHSANPINTTQTGSFSSKLQDEGDNEINNEDSHLSPEEEALLNPAEISNLSDLVAALLSNQVEAQRLKLKLLPVGNGLQALAKSNQPVVSGGVNKNKEGGGGGFFSKGFSILKGAGEALAAVATSGSNDNIWPNDSPHMILFVIGGITPTEIAEVNQRVQLANKVHNRNTKSNSVIDNDEQEIGNAPKELPSLQIGGSCLLSPEALFAQCCL